LEKDSEKRFSIKDIIGHMWIDDFSEPEEIGFRLGKNLIGINEKALEEVK
jgi:hypothetical protein